MRKLSHVIVAGIIVGELFAVISCSRSVATKPSAQPTPSTTKTDIDIAEIKNLSLEVELWSCEDDRQADQRRKFLFREALETLKSKFPQWNIANNPAGPSEKDGRYALDISIECCGVDEE